MTTPTGYTANWLLAADRGEATEGLGTVLARIAQSGVLGKLSNEFFGHLRQQLSDATFGLLDIDLGSLLVDGWRAHRTLVAAARSTMDRPGSVELVELARHEFAVTHQPAIDISVNGVLIGTIRLDLTLKLAIDALLGKVSQGRLVELQIGRCTATAKLAAEAVPLASGELRLDPSILVRLGTGLALLPAPGGPPAPAALPV